MKLNLRAFDGKKFHYQDGQYLISFLRRFVESVNLDNGIMSGHESYLPNDLETYLDNSTGVLDKNGNPIFDGDEIRIVYASDEYTYETIVENGGLVMSPSYAEYDYTMLEHLDDYEYIEVIGNVRETPDFIGDYL